MSRESESDKKNEKFCCYTDSVTNIDSSTALIEEY